MVESIKTDEGADEMTFGESLKRFRVSLGLNQKEFADVFNMKPPLYQRYESGKTTPSVDFIYKITNKYGVSADYLLGLSDTPRPVPADKALVDAIKNARDSIQKVLSEVDRVAAE